MLFSCSMKCSLSNVYNQDDMEIDKTNFRLLIVYEVLGFPDSKTNSYFEALA